MKYLIDTCVISEIITKRPNPQVINWIDSQTPETLYLSVITIGEIAKGIHKLPDSQRKSILINWLTQDLLNRFSEKIQPLDVGTMLLWGELLSRLESQGRTLPLLDSLIAAIALHGSFCLVTRNEKDFNSTGVNVLNPF